MPLMLSKLYHALKYAGVDEQLAMDAAEEAAKISADYEPRFDSIEQKLTRIEGKVEVLAEQMKGSFLLLYWMGGFILVMLVGLMWKVFK